ncbi:MAG: hypothetical protein QOD33_666 [Pyrinomonadaceae bacterium]|jgi:hypothetical protein|nr:hypothetical protein [Pyrinomonadaceae bacterium]
MTKARHNGNGHDPRHVTETPDVSHIRNPDVTHEASDVSVSGLVKFVVSLFVLGVFVFVLMWGMFRFLDTQEEEKTPPAGPMAMTEQERLPAEPRLQAARGFGVTLQNGERLDLEKREPQAEYRALLGQWQSQLNCAEPQAANHQGEEKSEVKVSANCLPINQAMEQVVSGLASRPAAGPGTAQQEIGVNPPTTESSGRIANQRKQ